MELKVFKVYISHVDTSEGFIYDYLDEDVLAAAVEGRDPSGTIVVPAYDSNREDTINRVEREWP